MRDPVLVTQTGHTYERAAIEDWLRKNSTDPMSAAPLPHSTLPWSAPTRFDPGAACFRFRPNGRLERRDSASESTTGASPGGSRTQDARVPRRRCASAKRLPVPPDSLAPQKPGPPAHWHGGNAVSMSLSLQRTRA